MRIQPLPDDKSIAAVTRVSVRLALAGAGMVLALLTVSACGSTTQIAPSSSSAPTQVTTAPDQSTPAAATASTTPAQIAALLSAKGVDCSSFATSDGADPGASSQGHCGTFPTVIDIAVFPSHNAMTRLFAAFLRDFYCSSTPDEAIVDGGTYAIYTIPNAVTAEIATALGIPATKLC